MEIAKSIIILSCQLKNEMLDVSVLTIILRTDDKKMKEKGMEVNFHLKELIKEKGIFLKLITQKRLKVNILIR